MAFRLTRHESVLSWVSCFGSLPLLFGIFLQG
jgi:hypothetical protein